MLGRNNIETIFWPQIKIQNKQMSVKNWIGLKAEEVIKYPAFVFLNISAKP